jgi:hypothetical protein
VSAELVLKPAIDLRHPVRPALSLQDDIHGAANAVLYEKLGGSESLLVLELIGDDRLASAKGKAGGRCKVIPDGLHTNDDRLPAHTSADQKTFLCRNVFENLGKLSLQALSRHARGVVQQLIETRALKSRHPRVWQVSLVAGCAALAPATERMVRFHWACVQQSASRSFQVVRSFRMFRRNWHADFVRAAVYTGQRPRARNRLGKKGDPLSQNAARDERSPGPLASRPDPSAAALRRGRGFARLSAEVLLWPSSRHRTVHRSECESGCSCSASEAAPSGSVLALPARLSRRWSCGVSSCGMGEDASP